MGSNFFSDMLSPIFDVIDRIPIIGDIQRTIEKAAAVTDPSQLLTSAIGKMIGGDFEDQYTSEEARIGAARSVGGIYLAYLLGGGGGGSAAASGGEGVGGAGMAAGTSEGAIAASAAGEASGTVGSAAASSAEYGSLTAAELAAIAAEDTALASSGVTAGSSAGIITSGAAPYASSAGTLSESLASKVLSNTELINYLIKAGNALNPSKDTATSGSSITSRTISQQGLRSQDMDSLMGEALGPSESSALFDKKGITLKGEDSALSKRFLSGSDSLIKPKPVKEGRDLAFKTSVNSGEFTLNQAEVQEARESKDNGFSGMGNISLASPFYQPSV
jgi:hypothetical protein